MSYYIYKLEIGDYFYWGSSKLNYNSRLSIHKYNCYNPKRKGYNTKLYKKIRELCPNPKHFYDFIYYEKYYEDLDISTKKYMENMILQRYKDNKYSLNSNKGVYKHNQTKVDFDREHWGEYKREKIICEKCGMLISRNSIRKHQRTIKCMNEN